MLWLIDLMDRFRIFNLKKYPETRKRSVEFLLRLIGPLMWRLVWQDEVRCIATLHAPSGNMASETA